MYTLDNAIDTISENINEVLLSSAKEEEKQVMVDDLDRGSL